VIDAPKSGPAPTRHRKQSVYPQETLGLLIIAIVILIFTLVRYWGHIPWGAR